ncbi:MAG TPA: hypothetical protein P5277_03160 [Candidatus Paceibacterota bacterium]|nr:hypothetical protein [Candidatus Paceibacterota bacterium]
MKNEGFYIFGAVLLLTTVLIFMSVGITGNAVVKTDGSNCIDSDRGQNPFVKGSVVGISKVSGKTTSQIDKCSKSGAYLDETYCKKGILSIRTYKCTKGCSNGACIK